jgi:hypothetical protein
MQKKKHSKRLFGGTENMNRMNGNIWEIILFFVVFPKAALMEIDLFVSFID